MRSGGNLRAGVWLGFVLLASCVGPRSASAPDPAVVTNEPAARRLLAVLPLDVTHTSGKLSADGQASLEDMVRDVAANELTPSGWTILTGETMLQVLVDSGVDPTKCGDESCHLGSARKLNVEKFISGAVQFVDGQFTASIRLIDTKSGRILASMIVEGKTVTELRKTFAANANAFFAQGGMNSGPVATPPPTVTADGTQVSTGAVTEAVGKLLVTAKPKGLVRLELVDPNGKQATSGTPYENAAAEPGRWKVTARATGYEEVVQDIEVEADAAKAVNLELKLLGGLSVTGEPVGAAVRVTGPGGFAREGGLPWTATGLKNGAYQVKVTRKSYADADETIEVVPGQTAALKVTLRKGVTAGAGMIAIPGGTFNYGCEPGDGGCYDNEKPGKSVTVQAFSMGKTDVTVEAYAKCVSAGKCSEPNTGGLCTWGVSGKEQHPVNCLDWNQAKTFCEWAGGRLPTAEEWEYAAKGGESRVYPWGNNEPSASLAKFGPSDGTAPVGSYPAGATKHGLLDMAGNVWQWTASNYDANTKEVRGGSWVDDPRNLRASDRDRYAPADRNNDVGARCAL
jgi:formylglycine-generating enzyme required for sulfatase activity